MNFDYLKEMINSLVNQSVKEFDLVVVNDGIEEFSSFVKDYTKDFNIIELKGVSSPAKNRQRGINYCIEKGYAFLVWLMLCFRVLFWH